MSGNHTKTGGTSIAGYTWTYDAASRKTTFNFTDATKSDENVTYAYDNTDQLTGADRSGTTNDETYGYDENGNRTTGGFTVTVDNRYSSVTIDGVVYNLTYDAEGNLTKKTNASTGAYTDYFYDHRNRLYQVDEKAADGTLHERSLYTYDIFDRRVIKSYDPDGAGATVPTETKWIYDGQNPVLEFTNYDPAGTAGDILNGLTHRYLYGNLVDQVLADERFTPANNSTNWLPSSAPGTVLTPLTDDQNTTRDLVNTSGTVQNHIKYNSFGRVTAESATAVDYLFGYTGFVRDEETKLDVSDTRTYSSELNRWLQPDWIGFDGGDYNTRRFIGNSTPNGIDPRGLKAEGTFAITVSQLGGGAISELSAKITWYPPSAWLKKGNHPCEVGLFQTAKTVEEWSNAADTFNDWHADNDNTKSTFVDWRYGAGIASPIAGQLGRSLGGSFAQLLDDPGVQYPTTFKSRLLKLEQSWETGAVVLDKKSSRYGEVLGVVKWGHIVTWDEDAANYVKTIWVQTQPGKISADFGGLIVTKPFSDPRAGPF